jgi:hypothetical protein
MSEPSERDLIDAIDFLFAEKQGHCPGDLYEDGYSDACADIKIAIRRLFGQPLPSPPEESK